MVEASVSVLVIPSTMVTFVVRSTEAERVGGAAGASEVGLGPSEAGTSVEHSSVMVLVTPSTTMV
jgi:hypothetical protein